MSVLLQITIATEEITDKLSAPAVPRPPFSAIAPGAAIQTETQFTSYWKYLPASRSESASTSPSLKKERQRHSASSSHTRASPCTPPFNAAKPHSPREITEPGAQKRGQREHEREERQAETAMEDVNASTRASDGDGACWRIHKRESTRLWGVLRCPLAYWYLYESVMILAWNPAHIVMMHGSYWAGIMRLLHCKLVEASSLEVEDRSPVLQRARRMRQRCSEFGRPV